jgi:hypothetical protein
MITTSLLQNRYGPTGIGKGKEVPSVTKNFLESFNLTVNPLDNFIRIVADEFLLGRKCTNFRKLFFNFLAQSITIS